jgi:hypothetical protein
MDTLAEDEYLGRYLAYRKEYTPKAGPATNGNAKQDRPLFKIDVGAKPSPWQGDAPQPEAAAAGFDRLPPEAQSAIAAAAAKRQGAGPLYPSPDGQPRKLSDNLIANVAMLETMYVPAPGDPSPYTFDQWVGFAVNYGRAYRAMLVVCTCLSQGKPVPEVGKELEHELAEEDPPNPPAPAESAEGRPGTSGMPSNVGTPTPTPSGTTTPPSAPSPEACEPSASSWESPKGASVQR